MHSTHVHAVILAGGHGTRFWPASRRALPKQFLPIAGRQSLIAETAARLKGWVDLEHTLVVTSVEHVELVRKHLRKLPPENILAEPVGRNTAASVAWAALEIEKRDPHGAHVVLPSDHVIEPARDFRRVLAAATDEALESSALITLGIQPTFAATGYGYIESGERLHARSGASVHRVRRFVEKPNRERAEEFLRTGGFFWNAGIFAWSTPAILAALRRHTPELVRALASVQSEAERVDAFSKLSSVAVDVAILEKVDNVRVIPIDFRWSDVGSWAALPEVQPLDANENCSSGGGKLVAEDSNGCVVYGKSGEITALIGVNDLVVVRSGKAVLVCPRARAQDVKLIVARLEQEAPSYL
jgi:mannose-1-phosphate guanylyltransferase